MPEGVEVKISADLIKPLVIGKTIKASYSTANSRYGDSRANNNQELGMDLNKLAVNSFKVNAVKVKGKFMFWELDNYTYMMCTFGMSGQWSPIQGKHPCFVFEFTDGTSIYFNDPRHFGTIKFVESFALLNAKLSSLGWDPLSEDWNKWSKYITNQIQISHKPIGELLMNQKFFAGVGNYIRAEALYSAKISPWRVGNKLNSNEIDLLAESIVKVMKESYDHQGATISTYKDSYGKEGKYSSCFKVYGQKSDPLGHNIIKETTPEGRSIHWCPNMQI